MSSLHRKIFRWEGKKETVVDYTPATRRKDMVYVWGCSATGALGMLISVDIKIIE